jgi:pRiA4b ORF-3-like protein
MDANEEPVIYQLRVVLDGISPLIWRRLLLPGDYSISDLHFILQIAFDWDDWNLHRFFIHGR